MWAQSGNSCLPRLPKTEQLEFEGPLENPSGFPSPGVILRSPSCSSSPPQWKMRKDSIPFSTPILPRHFVFSFFPFLSLKKNPSPSQPICLCHTSNVSFGFCSHGDKSINSLSFYSLQEWHYPIFTFFFFFPLVFWAILGCFSWVLVQREGAQRVWEEPGRFRDSMAGVLWGPRWILAGSSEVTVEFESPHWIITS